MNIKNSSRFHISRISHEVREFTFRSHNNKVEDSFNINQIFPAEQYQTPSVPFNDTFNYTTSRLHMEGIDNILRDNDRSSENIGLANREYADLRVLICNYDHRGVPHIFNDYAGNSSKAEAKVLTGEELQVLLNKCNHDQSSEKDKSTVASSPLKIGDSTPLSIYTRSTNTYNARKLNGLDAHHPNTNEQGYQQNSSVKYENNSVKNEVRANFEANSIRQSFGPQRSCNFGVQENSIYAAERRQSGVLPTIQQDHFDFNFKNRGNDENINLCSRGNGDEESSIIATEEQPLSDSQYKCHYRHRAVKASQNLFATV